MLKSLMKTNHSARINLRVPIPLKVFFNQLAKQQQKTLSCIIVRVLQDEKKRIETNTNEKIR